MNNTDLISVIIPTYNRAHLIKRSAQSVLNQTYKNLELIIVDDGSTDNTKEVIDSLNDERIVYVKQENHGVSSARNTGINVANGKYIAFQDSDDIWHSDKLEKQINTLKQNNADIVFCKIFKHGNIIKRVVSKKFKAGFLPKNILPIDIFPQTILGKTIIFKNDLFDINLLELEDFELLLRIQKKYSIYCIDEPMVDYCAQDDSLSKRHEIRIDYLKMVVNNNANFLQQYKHSSLDFLAQEFLYAAFNIKDLQKRKDALSFIFTISNSINVKTTYLLHKIYFYKLKSLLYKTASKVIRKIIKH